ncbi:MAG: tyrosine-protein phosphatase [Ruminococcaceae bacterium]|nr:tyrosine-protein phosphatase [Oscillospiraceae bacterium]
MRIELEGLLNTRDLGGITGHEGKMIKMGRVIRSDNLSPATENDCKKLNKYGLKKIVDFRTNDEIAASPDKTVCGAEWIHSPILKSLTTGITRKEAKKPSCLAEILLNFSLELGENGKSWLASLYIPLVSDEFCLKGYRKFLDVLKDNKEGAVLYHCSAGKDRVGIGTLIFLSALGVSRENIIKDYLLTNESYAAVINEARMLGRTQGVSEKILDTIEPLSGVDISYITAVLDVIDNTHGGMDSFLKNQLGLDESYLDELQKNYLE